MREEKEYEVIIVGAGFAGLSAALWLGRYRRRTLIIGKGQPRNAKAKAMHGYPGLEGANPIEVLHTIKSEALTYSDVTFREAFVTAVTQEVAHFTVRTEDNEIYTAKRLLLATGLEDVHLGIPGLPKLEGRSVWHCPACDGYEYIDKRISVIGWGPQIASYAQLFLTYSPHVTVMTHGNRLSSEVEKQLQEHGIDIIKTKITHVAQHTDGHRITLTDNTKHMSHAIFYTIDSRPRIGLARQLGCEVIDDTYVTVNDKQETSVPGVYAAGDIAPYEELVVVACSTGTIAASNIHKSL